MNGVEKSIIDFVLMSNDLVKHIEHIHVNDEQVHVLSKNIITKVGTSYTESDHNIINTKLNIKWSAKKSKVMEVFKYKDKESPKMFKNETTNTDQLSKIVDNDKPLDIVTKELLKQIEGFVNQCFKKLKIVDKEDKQLQDLYNRRRILRTKTDEESLKQLEDLETELCNKYSEVMSAKIIGELKYIGDSEDGGFNAGNLWKLKNKLFAKIH